MKKKKPKEEITIKPSYKHRVPHKPTKVHRNKKKYTRKGKTKDKRQEEVLSDIEEAVLLHLCNQCLSSLQSSASQNRLTENVEISWSRACLRANAQAGLQAR